MLVRLNAQAEIVKGDLLPAHHAEIVEIEQGWLSAHGFQVYVILNPALSGVRDLTPAWGGMKCPGKLSILSSATMLLAVVRSLTQASAPFSMTTTALLPTTTRLTTNGQPALH